MSAWQLATLTFFGRVLLAVLVGTLVLPIDMYAVSFRYEPFFFLVGIELVLTGIAAWIRFLVRTRSTGV